MIVLVPRRPDGGRRDQLWEFTRARWKAYGWTIYEGAEQGEGPFSRSVAINAAAEAAKDDDWEDWNVVMVADADVILIDPAGQALDACVHAVRTGRLTYAHDRLVMTTEAQADAILAGHNPEEATLGETRHANTWSQAFAVPRELWDAVGGFDERFVGWGWEDLSFMSACWALAGGAERVHGDAYHLWHPRGEFENEQSPTHSANQVLGERYLAARHDPQAMLAILAER